MSHEKLKWMKDSLICVVENELCNLGEVDTKELGEAIDMIKDLEEAIYYCTVTEAMKNPFTYQKFDNEKGHEAWKNSGTAFDILMHYLNLKDEKDDFFLSFKLR